MLTSFLSGSPEGTKSPLGSEGLQGPRGPVQHRVRSDGVHLPCHRAQNKAADVFLVNTSPTRLLVREGSFTSGFLWRVSSASLQIPPSGPAAVGFSSPFCPSPAFQVLPMVRQLPCSPRCLPFTFQISHFYLPSGGVAELT